MEFKDYYKILGVSRDADGATIKREYRKQARANHPDLNQGDATREARFKEINEAHEVLGDPDVRRKYDEYIKVREMYGEGVGPFDPAGEGFDYQSGGAGGDPFAGAGFGGGNGGGGSYRFYGGDGFSAGEGFGEYSEFFEQIFGGGAGRTGGGTRTATGGPGAGVFRGGDLRSQLPVSLDELYHGGERAFQLGSETIRVRIPAGFPEGGTLKLSGRGRPGMGDGPRGDLYLKIVTEKHPRFERRGDDLHHECPVDLYTMLLGGQDRIETLKGGVNLKIPSGSQNGDVLRLKGLGMPRHGRSEEFGDLFVRLSVRLPEKLSAEERAMFRKLAGKRDAPRDDARDDAPDDRDDKK